MPTSAKINPFTGKLDLVGSTTSGGVTTLGGVAGQVAFFTGVSSIGGDPGLTYNSATDALTLDGTLFGGDGATDALVLSSNSTLAAPGVSIEPNAFGEDRLLLGPGPDPSEFLVPGGVLEFVVTSDNPAGVGAVFGGYGSTGSGGTAVTFFAVATKGTLASPAETLNGDKLFAIGAYGVDNTNTVILDPEAASLRFRQSGASGAGFVPAAIEFSLTRADGTFATYLHLNANGNAIFNNALTEVSAEAGLELHATDAEPKFLLFPTLSDTGEGNFAAAVDGGMYYNTTDPAFHAHVNGTWVSLITDDGAGNVLISGKLTVTGDIDPTRVLLSGADKRFGATDAGPIYLAPFIDSTTAIQVRKADNTTVLLNIDTSNGHFAFNTSAAAGTYDFTNDDVDFFLRSNNSTTRGSQLFLSHARGTLAVPAALQTGDILGKLIYAGQESVAIDDFAPSVLLVAEAVENFTTSALGADLIILTTPAGTATPVECARITNLGRLGLGTPAPAFNFHAVADGFDTFAFENYSSTAATTSRLTFRRGKNTFASPQAVDSTYILGQLLFFGYDGASFPSSSCSIQCVAEETFTAGAKGGRLAFFTTTIGTTGSVERLRILDNGNVTISSARSGAVELLTVSNTSNTASAKAQIDTIVAGTTADDPFHTFTITSGTTWAIGADNSDSDKFKVSRAATLGTNDAVAIDTSNGVTLGSLAGVGTRLVTADTNGLLATISATTYQPLDADLTEIAAVANVRGDLLVTDAGPTWVRLAVGTSGKFLRSDGTDPSWQNIAAGDITSGTLALARGGTNADLSGTGGASQVLKQTSAGAAITVAQLAFTDISGSVTDAQVPNTLTLTNITGGVADVAYGIIDVCGGRCPYD